METDEILQIAARLKKEGRAISPVTVCLEVYGQALPEITATLQQWRAEQQSASEGLREDSPVPTDLRELMREAVEQCWAGAQQVVRRQVDHEIQELRTRAQDAERETGMLYLDLTRALSDLQSRKSTVGRFRHPMGRPDFLSDPMQKVEAEHGGASGDPVGQAHDGCSAQFFENGDNAHDHGDEGTARSGTELEPHGSDGNVPQTEHSSSANILIAQADARAAAAQAQVQELEAELARVREAMPAGAESPDSSRDQADAAQRIIEIERAFTAEREMLHAKLQDCALQSSRWKQEAEQLRDTIDPLRQHAKWLNVQAVGHNALCSKLMEALHRIDPGNELLREDIKQQIIAEASEDTQ